MAVVLRLKRTGRRNRPFYRICVFDSRTRRDGRTIEELGHYDPLAAGDAPNFQLDEERVKHWLAVGARPSDTVATLIRRGNIELPKSGKPRKRRTKGRAPAKG